MLTKRSTQTGTLIRLLAGVGSNIFLKQFYENEVSWLWWNAFGFLITFVLGYFISQSLKIQQQIKTELILNLRDARKFIGEKKNYLYLSIAFVVMLIFGLLMEKMLLK